MRRATLALRVALAYAIFGVAWILASDRVVEAMAPSAETSALAQTFKGLAFVGLSAALTKPESNWTRSSKDPHASKRPLSEKMGGPFAHL